MALIGKGSTLTFQHLLGSLLDVEAWSSTVQKRALSISGRRRVGMSIGSALELLDKR
ncbi:hypothetical protein [Xanthomonas sp. D-109]|uniref:hypothetical protein n=1 Tax=Xanthomonas sp. D-109 TaxID=2821274 RepID=UPI001ADACF9C|nr:hypothetical protein [Xanthomonas sp. D-109]MBO9881035.1 hypothetical protein [Xanthomonas sp. D-109]